MGNALEHEITRMLRRAAPYAFDDEFPPVPLSRRFFVAISPPDEGTFVILDRQWDLITYLSRMMIENPMFDLASWYEDQLILELENYQRKMGRNMCLMRDQCFRDPDDNEGNGSTLSLLDLDQRLNNTYLELNGVQVPRGTYPVVQ